MLNLTDIGYCNSHFKWKYIQNKRSSLLVLNGANFKVLLISTLIAVIGSA